MPVQYPVRAAVHQKYPCSSCQYQKHTLQSSVSAAVYQSTPEVPCQYSSPPGVPLQCPVGTAVHQRYVIFSLQSVRKFATSTFTVLCQSCDPSEVPLQPLSVMQSAKTKICDMLSLVSTQVLKKYPYSHSSPPEVTPQSPVSTQIVQKYPYSLLSVLKSSRNTPTVPCQYSSPPEVPLQSAVSTQVLQKFPYSLLSVLKSSRSSPTVPCQYSSPPEVPLQSAVCTQVL